MPEKLFLLKQNLRVLDLSSNQIEIVPEAIGGFIQMKSLCMDKNLLSKLRNKNILNTNENKPIVTLDFLSSLYIYL